MKDELPENPHNLYHYIKDRKFQLRQSFLRTIRTIYYFGDMIDGEVEVKWGENPTQIAHYELSIVLGYFSEGEWVFVEDI